MKPLSLLLTVAISFFVAFQANASVHIIPQPASVIEKSGAYILPQNLTIGYSDKSLEPAAEYLVQKLAPATGYEITAKKGLKGNIRLVLADPNPDNEAYTLNSSIEGVTIQASSYKGIINGISTLRQLLPYQIESPSVLRGLTWEIPAVQIQDNPVYEWRGLMLDPVRHFYSVDETKRLLDVMALYKYNKFHWHLIDSNAWRIEIRKYPLLTDKGAWRDPRFEFVDQLCESRAINESNPTFHLPQVFMGQKDGNPVYGGFYTQEDIRDVVAYAAVRGIDVVPEIDMPGHNWMATQCYPWLSCGHDGNDPLCLGSDSTLMFARDVFTEVFELFPYHFAEIGGDEVGRARWANCPLCQDRIKKENLAGLEELQSWFTREMEKFFNENGRRLIGWDEILEGGVSPTATVNWWQGYHADVVQRSTAGGNEVICCPTTFCYFDYPQDNNTMRVLYEGDIVPTDLNDDQKKLVKGLQGNIWGEQIPTEARMQYMTFPRALALVERAWTPQDLQGWDSYCSRLEEHLKRLRVLNVNYRPINE